MNEYQLLINYHPSDREIAHQIYDMLQAKGVSCQLLPRVASMETHFEVLDQIEKTMASSGALLVVLSEAALQDDWVLANTQYSCDLAARRTMLVIYQVEDLPEDHPFKLYFPQAVVITDFKKKGQYSRLLNTVKRVLGNPDAKNAFRPRVLSKKFIKGAVSFVVVLSLLSGVGRYVYPKVVERLQPDPPLEPTPILSDKPFSGESIDQKISVDRRDVPSVDFEEAPKTSAPFSFEPDIIQEQFTFDEPDLENINVLSASGYYGNNAISEKDKTVVRQQNGVLQVAVAPSSDGENQIHFELPHLMPSDSCHYLGVRFLLEDYPGWSDEKLENGFGFHHSSLSHDLMFVNIGRRQIQPSPTIYQDLLLSSGWHALEVVRSQDSSRLDIYLDGELIGGASIEGLTKRYEQLSVFLYTQYSTDWINLYIDEVVYGGEAPLKPALQVEDVSYFLMPDEVFYEQSFAEMPSGALLAQGEGFGRVQEDKFIFEISPEHEHEGISFQIPGIIYPEVNYFSFRYRLSNWQQEPWADWGEFSIRLHDPDFMDESGCSIGVFESVYRAEYSLTGGNNRIESLIGSWENFQPGAWHTVEMALRPLDLESGIYLLYYWHDGYQVKQMEVDDLASCLGEGPLVAEFFVDSGFPRQKTLSGEIDEITVGKINFSNWEDFNHAGEE
jgi:hypothetical protein